MKKKYLSPQITTILVETEESLCNASSQISLSKYDLDYQQEWEDLGDDERLIQW